MLEEKDITLKILKELNKLVTIPDRGFLAGGAVANTLLRMKNGKGIHDDNLFPINDLDIFIVSDHENIQGSTPLRTKELIIKEGYYGGDIGYDEASNYRILSVERDGLINTIVISQIRDLQNNGDYMYILNGFDFNCCQIGIDLSTGNLFYTSQFAEFFRSNQLDISAMYTPGHTAIRLFKKIKELNCYCDVEKCMEILSQPLIPSIRWRLMRGQWGFYFSHKYKDMFMEYFTHLKPYFKMVKFFDDKKDLWYQKHNEINDFSMSDDKKHVSNWLNPNNSISQESLSKWAEYNDRLWALRPVKYSEPNRRIMDKAYLGYSSPIGFINAYHYINGKIKKSLHKKCDLIIENSKYLQKIVMINLEFANCDFSLSHVKELDEYCKREIDFLFGIQKYGLNLQESLILFKDIKKIENKEGEWLKFIILESLRKNNKNIKPTYETMLKDVILYKESMSTPLTHSLIDVEKLYLPQKVRVKEILSETEMQWAGQKLKNCINNVGQGYKESIESGLVKIFVIMSQGSTSALELHLDSIDAAEVREKQLLSSCNRKPSRFHRVIADMLITHINILRLEENYKNKRKLYNDILNLQNGLLVTTSDDSTDDNPEVFDPLQDVADHWNQNEQEGELDIMDDFQFDFVAEPRVTVEGERDINIIETEMEGTGNNNLREEIENIITFSDYLDTQSSIEGHPDSPNIFREWVSRTITPPPLDYTINTTLRGNDNDVPDPDDV
jgi:hypothetical protein